MRNVYKVWESFLRLEAFSCYPSLSPILFSRFAWCLGSDIQILLRIRNKKGGIHEIMTVDSSWRTRYLCNLRSSLKTESNTWFKANLSIFFMAFILVLRSGT